MQPSAPALGVPPDSKGGKVPAAVAPQNHADHVDTLSACAIATRPGRLLTRLSLHGQGVRTIEGLEACHNLRVLVSYFTLLVGYTERCRPVRGRLSLPPT